MILCRSELGARVQKPYLDWSWGARLATCLQSGAFGQGTDWLDYPSGFLCDMLPRDVRTE